MRLHMLKIEYRTNLDPSMSNFKYFPWTETTPWLVVARRLKLRHCFCFCEVHKCIPFVHFAPAQFSAINLVSKKDIKCCTINLWHCYVTYISKRKQLNLNWYIIHIINRLSYLKSWIIIRLLLLPTRIHLYKCIGMQIE